MYIANNKSRRPYGIHINIPRLSICLSFLPFLSSLSHASFSTSYVPFLLLFFCILLFFAFSIHLSSSFLLCTVFVSFFIPRIRTIYVTDDKNLKLKLYRKYIKVVTKRVKTREDSTKEKRERERENGSRVYVLFTFHLHTCPVSYLVHLFSHTSVLPRFLSGVCISNR